MPSNPRLLACAQRIKALLDKMAEEGEEFDLELRLAIEEVVYQHPELCPEGFGR